MADQSIVEPTNDASSQRSTRESSGWEDRQPEPLTPAEQAEREHERQRREGTELPG